MAVMSTNARGRLVLDAEEGVDPEIGRWLAAMDDARRDTLAELEGTTSEAVDARPPGSENSIGTSLYHLAVIEADWLFADLLGQSLETAELAPLFPYDVRDERGILKGVVGVSLKDHLERLAQVRATLRREIGALSLEDFLAVRARDNYDVSGAWVVHHLLQHEAEHRSEIGWLRRHAEDAP
jgi:hypothetical protein